MISITICDDEKAYIDKISNLIKDNTPNEIKYEINTYFSGEDLLSSVNDCKIDILFLDIEMKELNGIETAKELKKYFPDCIIFFVTSYNNYITDAFRLNSFQFLQKPINYDDFKYDYNRALEKYKNNHIYIEVKSNGNIRKIPVANIKYVEVFVREIKIHLDGLVIEHNGKFSDYEEKLQMADFSKTHKSYLINLSQVEVIEKNNVKLKGISDYIPIGRNYKKQFMDEYHKYMIGRCL